MYIIHDIGKNTDIVAAANRVRSGECLNEGAYNINYK